MISEEGFAPVKDGKLFYKAGGSGHSLVVIHGGPGMDHHTFLPQFERLTETVRVILYDQRACGKSSGYPYEATTRLPIYVNDLETLRQHLSLKEVAILGFSFGGLLAMSYAIAHPDVVSKRH